MVTVSHDPEQSEMGHLWDSGWCSEANIRNSCVGGKTSNRFPTGKILSLILSVALVEGKIGLEMKLTHKPNEERWLVIVVQAPTLAAIKPVPSWGPQNCIMGDGPYFGG